MPKFLTLVVLACAGSVPSPVNAEETPDQRLRYVASRLDARIDELDKGDRQLPLLLEQLAVMAAEAPKQKEKDSSKFKFHMDEKLFAKTNEANAGTFFDLDKVSIKIRNRHVAVPLSTILDTICTQIDAGYVVRNDCIEIVPIQVLRKELNHPNGPDSDLRNLVVRFYDNVPLQTAMNDLAERYNRNVILSPLAQKELDQKITARLLNVPFDVAVEALADLADLKLVRKANVTLVTTREQAAALNAEYEKRHKAERERPTSPRERLSVPVPLNFPSNSSSRFAKLTSFGTSETLMLRSTQATRLCYVA